MESLAILPANLLLSDPSSEWLKTAVPIALQYDLSTTHNIVAGLAGDEGAARQNGASWLLRTSIESRQGGLHIESTLVDVATQKVVRVESSDASSASVVLPSVNALAKKIDLEATEFSTKITPAWQALASAELDNNAQQRARFLQQATGLDKNFGFAWVSLMTMVDPNRQAELKSMIDEAKSHRDAFSLFDRTRFDLAMNRLSNAAPADQIKTAQEVLKVAPNDLESIITLGNYQILQGDFASGEQSLRRAAALSPANMNLRFALANGLIEVRKFKEAEAVLTSIDKTPSAYPLLATCALMQGTPGDKARASTYLEKFLSSIPSQHDEVKPLLRAAWQVMSGDRQQGVDALLNATFKTPNYQALALSEAAIWQAMGNDYAGAQKSAAALSKLSTGQPSPLPVLTALLIDKTSSIADWQKRVESLSLPTPIRQQVLGYGFFLHGNFDESAKTWQQVADASHGTDLYARAMLASSLDHLGNKSGAQRISVTAFNPELLDLYSAIAFTEMRRMLPK